MTDKQVILLAEDEGLIALDLQLSLEENGLHVIGPYATVEECLEALEEEDCDMAILDVDLKGKDVYPVAERLEKKGVPFVFHTGHANKDDIRKKFPAAKVFRKPTTIENLVAPLSQAAR